ncbi:hypothetical protein IVA96_23850 [Bradyrhizobium sp. 159]|nr:hypothetical protein [Bradyrhizobium sp. 159]MCK1619553.1 hypothetical protein [Bradyrhizobium sp. 159]
MTIPPKDRKHQREPAKPQPTSETRDPAFDDLDGADVEFTAWRWPERADD